MSRPAISAMYFVLTFVAGAAVGSWALWVYLMGFPAGQENSAPPAAPVAEVISTPPPLPSPPPRITPHTEAEDANGTPAPRLSDAAPPEASTESLEPATPTPKGHWNTVDVPGRSHEECLALHKELNDAYKDCRFGVHKKEWIPE